MSAMRGATPAPTIIPEGVTRSIRTLTASRANRARALSGASRVVPTLPTMVDDTRSRPIRGGVDHTRASPADIHSLTGVSASARYAKLGSVRNGDT